MRPKSASPEKQDLGSVLARRMKAMRQFLDVDVEGQVDGDKGDAENDTWAR